MKFSTLVRIASPCGLCALLASGAAQAAAKAEPPSSEQVRACYGALKGEDANAKGKCLELELALVQSEYKAVSDRVAALARALDKNAGGGRTRWNKSVLAGQSFESYVKRDCDFVEETTDGAKRLKANAGLSCRIGYYRMRTSVLTNRHFGQGRR